MNLLQLVLKQMRQRALSTSLTFVSVTLGVALAIAILLLYREGDKLFTQADFGFDVLVGPKTGGNLNTVLNAVYQIGNAPTPIGYRVYEELVADPDVRWALPWAVGDNYEGYRVVGTTPAVLGLDDELKPLPQNKVFEFRQNRRLEVAQGESFHPRKFQAVIGSEVARRAGLQIGSKFKASHGAEKSEFKDEHDEQWQVTGILKPTQTALDRVILIPIISALAVPAHAEAVSQIAALQEKDIPVHEPATAITHPEKQHDAHAPATAAADDAEDHDHDADEDHDPDQAGHHHHEHAYHMDGDLIHLELPQDKWAISAVFVRTVGGRSQNLIFAINNRPYASAMNPAWEMSQFFEGFMKGSRALLLSISALVTVVAAVGILVSIYNSVSARLKEIAIIRALGATRLKVLALICLEAGLVGLIGAVAGLLAGHALGAVGNIFFRRYVGEGINFLSIGREEIAYMAIVVMIAMLAGIVPAMKAYRTPVATNLVG